MINRTRKRIVIAFTVISVLIGIALLSMRRRAPISLVRITFTGPEPGHPYRAAAFDVTNSETVSIALWEVEIQVQSNGVWNTISTKQAQASHFGVQTIIQPRDATRIIVEWPDEKPWRIQIHCGREAKGIRGVVEESWAALQTRTMPHFQSQTWNYSGMIQSDEIHR